MTQGSDSDDDRPRVFADHGYLSGDSTPLWIGEQTNWHDICCSRFDERRW